MDRGPAHTREASQSWGTLARTPVGRPVGLPRPGPDDPEVVREFLAEHPAIEKVSFVCFATLTFGLYKKAVA